MLPAPRRFSPTLREVPGVHEELSDDTLLDGRVRLRQPKDGYRVAIDPVLLAAAVPVEHGEQILDAGAGTGAASLCLASRVPACKVTGLEVSRDVQRIASENVRLNRLEGRVEMLVGDVDRPPPRLISASFDHVMTNPPHLSAQAASPSPVPGRARAHHEGGVDLAAWLLACVRMLRPSGRLTMIHRADRLDAILAVLSERLGDLILFPLWPNAENRPARRVLIQGRKGSRAPLRLAHGLVLHEPHGAFTPAAECVLRQGKPLPLAEMDPA